MIPAAFAPQASHLWQSTVFAVVVALVTWSLRRNRARIRYWLWSVASYKFLLPFAWLVSIGHHFQGHAAPAILPLTFTAMVDRVSGPIFPAAFSPTEAASNHLPALVYLVWAVWAGGFLTITAGWSLEWLRIRGLVRVASPLHLGLPIRALSTSARLEPGVFGVFRPVLLLPEGIAARLTQAQLETVLAHELCHVRRRDNLTAALHMLVESVFWFHPFVWWLGKRMVEEREHACDEEVLQAGSPSQVYAESILKVCEFYLESPLTCFSGVTGSDLKERIRRIMKKHFGVALSFRKKFFLLSAGVAALAVPVFAGALTSPHLRAQTSTIAEYLPKFEIASITPNKAGAHGPGNISLRGGIYKATNVPLRVFLAAYYLHSFTESRFVIGGPDWIDSEGFDIEARADGNPGKGQVNLMVKSLLEDHFKLLIHREARQLPNYALLLSNPGKPGPQLTPHSDDAKCAATGTLPQPAPGETMPAYCGGFFIAPKAGDLRETGNNITMAMLSAQLIQSVDRMVVDRTGLNGVFDFSIEFAPELGPGSQPGAMANAPNPSAPPSIFDALPQQLGLKLEPQTSPVDVIVIDHVEEPTLN